MMQAHNEKVDEFTRKFDERDISVLDEIKKTDLFENKLSRGMPKDYKDELRLAKEADGFNL